LIAGMPLLTALAHAGGVDAALELAIEWRTPLPLLVDRLFRTAARSAAAELHSHPGILRLLRIPENDWNQAFDYDFGWWTDAGSDEGTRLLACRDVLALAVSPPWTTTPGSLADLDCAGVSLTKGPTSGNGSSPK